MVVAFTGKALEVKAETVRVRGQYMVFKCFCKAVLARVIKGKCDVSIKIWCRSVFLEGLSLQSSD